MRIDTITSGGYMQVQAAGAVPERRTVQLTASEAAEAARTGRADTLTLSEDAKKALDRLSREVDKQNEAAAMTYNMKQELENSKKASKAAADDASYKLKMLEIARRLQNGDRVPGKDEKALMEYDDKLYQVSKQIGMMKQNEKRKEYDSLLEDKEADTEVSAEPPPPEAVGVELSAAEGGQVTPADISTAPLE